MSTVRAEGNHNEGVLPVIHALLGPPLWKPMANEEEVQGWLFDTSCHFKV